MEIGPSPPKKTVFTPAKEVHPRVIRTDGMIDWNHRDATVYPTKKCELEADCHNFFDIPTWRTSGQTVRLPHFPAFLSFKATICRQLQASMTAEDVVGTAARDRYKVNNWRVPIEDSEAGAETKHPTGGWFGWFRRFVSIQSGRQTANLGCEWV